MSVPRMLPVESTAVAGVGFDAATRELYVQFAGGRLYVYSDVDEQHFNGLMSAESKGRYVNREIVPRYACREV